MVSEFDEGATQSGGRWSKVGTDQERAGQFVGELVFHKTHSKSCPGCAVRSQRGCVSSANAFVLDRRAARGTKRGSPSPPRPTSARRHARPTRRSPSRV